jgi:hypothetical protein
MVILLTIITVLVSLAVVYYAYEASRLGRVTEELEGENADLRGRITNLVGEVRRLRETYGWPSESQKQSADDELMPIRRTSRVATTKGRSGRSTGSPDLVVLVSSDTLEKQRISDALTANGYQVTIPLSRTRLGTPMNFPRRRSFSTCAIRASRPAPK